MLMSVLLDKLLEARKIAGSHECIVFFYCDATSRAEKASSVALLRSLLAQILAHDPQLADLIYQTGLKSGQLRASSMVHLTEMLRSLLNAETTFDTVTILIDALDECSDLSDCGLISLLLSLIGKTRLRLRTMLSSRAEPDLRNLLNTYQSVSITAMKTHSDIETYISTTLKSSTLAPLQQGRLIKHITQKLMAKSNGQFLWVRLVLHELCKASFVHEIDEILDDLPTGIAQAYLRVFERLGREPRRRQQVATALFRWLTCTERPLSLVELEFALSLQAGDDQLGSTKRMIDLPSLLEDVCGSLVEVVTAEVTVVRFVHVTIKEFLLSPKESWGTKDGTLLQFHVNPAVSHAYLASICVCRLSLPEVQELFNRKGGQETGDEDTLLAYASKFWALHLSKSGRPKSDLLRQVMLFMDSRKLEAYLDWYSREKTTAQAITMLQSHLNVWISKLNAGDPRTDRVVNRFRDYFEKTAQSRAVEFGQESPEYLENIHQLASLLHSAGLWSQAEVLARQCTEGRQRLFGLEDLLTLESSFQLGTLVRRLGRVNEAETLHVSILEGRRKLLGPCHPDTLDAEDELATTMKEAKTFEQICNAENLSRNTFLMKSRQYGTSHERTAITMNILAAILKDKALALRKSDQELLAVEALNECEELCRLCLDVRTTAFGEDHPIVSTTCNMLGLVTRHLGRLEESESWHQRTLIARQRAFGADNPHTQRSMRNLVNTFVGQCDLRRAEQMRQRLKASLRRNPELLQRSSWSDYKDD